MTTFWYNRTNDGESARFGTNEADIYRSKLETFMFVAEFYVPASDTHTYIFYLLRQDSAQLNIEKLMWTCQIKR